MPDPSALADASISREKPEDPPFRSCWHPSLGVAYFPHEKYATPCLALFNCIQVVPNPRSGSISFAVKMVVLPWRLSAKTSRLSPVTR